MNTAAATAAYTSLTTPSLCPCCKKTETLPHFDSDAASMCDNCLDALAGDIEIVVEATPRMCDDGETVNLSFADAASSSEDIDSEDVSPPSLPPPPAALIDTQAATHDAAKCCESCGNATDHVCKKGHRVCRGCMALTGECPLCEDGETGTGYDEDVIGRAGLDELVF